MKKWISIPYIIQKNEVYHISKKCDFDIKTVMIETTNLCNAKCEFCVNKSMKRNKQFMSDDIFESIIARLKEEKVYPEKFWMHLIGEPLLDER